MANQDNSRTTAASEPPGCVGLVADGWSTLADAASYYPEDLPPDWRLGYFANEHEGVCIDTASWRHESADNLRDWAEGVHSGFRFYLDLPTGEGPGDAAALRLAESLGERLGGCIHWTGTDSGRLLTPTQPNTDTGAWHETASALRCPHEVRDDLRSAAAWLRRIAGQHPATLVVLPSPSTAQLATWQDLRALLGIRALPTPE